MKRWSDGLRWQLYIESFESFVKVFVFTNCTFPWYVIIHPRTLLMTPLYTVLRSQAIWPIWNGLYSKDSKCTTSESGFDGRKDGRTPSVEACNESNHVPRIKETASFHHIENCMVFTLICFAWNFWPFTKLFQHFRSQSNHHTDESKYKRVIHAIIIFISLI